MAASHLQLHQLTSPACQRQPVGPSPSCLALSPLDSWIPFPLLLLPEPRVRPLLQLHPGKLVNTQASLRDSDSKDLEREMILECIV